MTAACGAAGDQEVRRSGVYLVIILPDLLISLTPVDPHLATIECGEWPHAVRIMKPLPSEWLLGPAGKIEDTVVHCHAGADFGEFAGGRVVVADVRGADGERQAHAGHDT